jgi:hypothetical protein
LVGTAEEAPLVRLQGSKDGREKLGSWIYILIHRTMRFSDELVKFELKNWRSLA